MKNEKDLKTFSEKQHSLDKWSSSKNYPMIPFLIDFVNFISLKRKYVYKLAKPKNENCLVLDLGCGKGAYANWFIKSNKNAKVVALDWSNTAVKTIPKTNNIFPVVADAQLLPFKELAFTKAYSIDTLGHIEAPQKALNELYRILQDDSTLFLHSECADYKYRWPDKILIKNLGADMIAEKDGHYFIKKSSEIYKLFHERFYVEQFISPAGITGWLTGYPENYLPLFKQSKMWIPFILCSIFSIFKKAPILKQLLQLSNSVINKLEIYFGINGGGSVFAMLRKRS